MKKIYKNFDDFKNNILKSLAPLVKTLEIYFWGNFSSDFRLKIDFKDSNNTTKYISIQLNTFQYIFDNCFCTLF